MQEIENLIREIAVDKPIEVIKAYVDASRIYRDQPSRDTALVLLQARLLVLRDAPESSTAEAIKTIPEWDILLAKIAGVRVN